MLHLAKHLLDPYLLGSTAPPFTVFFFRRRLNSGLSGFSLLWNTPGVFSYGVPGFQIEYFCDCTLHTLDLGVSPRYVATCIYKALQLNIFGFPAGLSQKTKLRKGVLQVRKRLKDYYNQERHANPWKQQSKLRKPLSIKMLGNPKAPCLQAKGGETRNLVKFATKLMEDFKRDNESNMLHQAGVNLVRFYETMAAEHRRLPLKSRKVLMDSAVRFCAYWKAAGGYFVHKHHGFVHMACDTHKTGNPSYCSTYEDESENGVVARIGAIVHGGTFATSVFERLELLRDK